MQRRLTATATAAAALLITLTTGCSAGHTATAAPKASVKPSPTSAFAAATVNDYMTHLLAQGWITNSAAQVQADSEAFCTGLRAGTDPGVLLESLREKGWSKSDALLLAAEASDSDHALCIDQQDRYGSWTLSKVTGSAPPSLFAEPSP